MVAERLIGDEAQPRFMKGWFWWMWLASRSKWMLVPNETLSHGVYEPPSGQGLARRANAGGGGAWPTSGQKRS